MQALIFDIKHFAVHDGPGIRTTVFFKGCPLNCWWCHNPESISSKLDKVQIVKRIGKKEFFDQKVIGKYISIDEIISEIEKDRVFYDESGGGVTFSGGEPLNQADFVSKLAKECKERKIHTTLDTSGYASNKVMAKVSRYIDLFLFDIKHIDPDQHKKYTGITNKKIFENLHYLSQTGKKIIFRYPVIPFINNSTKQIEQLIKFASKYTNEIHFLPFHKIGSHKYKQLGIQNKMLQIEELPVEYYDMLKEEIEKKGFLIRIGG